MRSSEPLVGIFDLDGTLLDSDAPLAAAFVTLGISARDITWGHVLAEECARLGISVEAYLDAYDLEAAAAFAGADELIRGLDRWAVCSNKHPSLGEAELARLGWEPEVALFADAFDGPKRLEPVLDVLGLTTTEVLFVGDTAHDRSCALDLGVTFRFAGWNPRATPGDGDVVLAHPMDLRVELGG